MKTRIISGLAMLPFALVLYAGGYWLMGVCFILTILAIREFFKGFSALSVVPSGRVAYGAMAVLYGINLLGSLKVYGQEQQGTLQMAWFFGVVLFSLLYLFKTEERKLEDGMATVVGVFYVGFFFYHVVLTQQLTELEAARDLLNANMNGIVWLIFLTAFGTDVMAYFSGVLFGRHKLCPKISPKKTIEGSVGGMLGSMVLCGIFGYFFLPLMIKDCLILGFLGGVLSQFGDLTASIFKRKMGVKDYGNLIPGHGGIMDRFDSVLFTAPLVYYYTVLFVLG